MSVKLSRLELASLLGMGMPAAAPAGAPADASADAPDEVTVAQSPAAPAPCSVETPQAAPSGCAQGAHTERSDDGPLAEHSEPRQGAVGFQDERHASAYLKKVLAGLWHKVEVERLTRPEQRERLLHLLQWAASKNGWVLETAVAQRYADVDRQVEGRLWVTLALDAQTRFALELAFEARQAPMAKLHAARQAGLVPLLLMPGTRLLAERMAELHRAFGAERLTWLQVLALTRSA